MNKLKLKDAKTELMVVISTQNQGLVKNNAACCLTKSTYRHHISPVCQHLQWDDRAVTGFPPRRTLRSSSDKLKLVLNKALNKYGKRSMRTLGAQLWNKLPLDLHNLESHAAFWKTLVQVSISPGITNWLWSRLCVCQMCAIVFKAQLIYDNSNAYSLIIVFYTWWHLLTFHNKDFDHYRRKRKCKDDPHLKQYTKY